MPIYLQTMCLGNVYQIVVQLDENPTWGWLASEAIRLALIQLERKSSLSLIDLFSSFRLLKVLSSQFGSLNFGDEITIDLLVKIGSSTIYIIIEGPFSSLSEKLLCCVSQYYSDKAKYISKLSHLSRRFRLLFQSDMIWKDLEIKYKWSGGGVDGTEQEEWNAYRIESGLPYFNTERIRAIANTTSRLRLYYGTIIDTYYQKKIGAGLNAGIFDSIFQRNLSLSRVPRRDLVLMIGRTGQQCGRDVHNSMHFMVPESATEYHLLPECKPIIKGGRIIRREASPKDSRSYKSFPDPGTLVEQAPIKYDNYNPGTNTVVEDYVFRIRRIGDDRLSFVQFNHDPALNGNEDDQQVHSLISNVLDRAASFVIIIEYDSEQEEECFQNLGSLYGEFISSRRRMLRELKKGNSIDSYGMGRTTVVTHPAPLLVLLSIDASSKSLSPLRTNMPVSAAASKEDLLEEQQELQGIEITNAVARTHEVLRDIIGSDSASNSSMPWYIQPYDRSSSQEGPFKSGVYPGINWMIRAMQKQNCTYKTY